MNNNVSLELSKQIDWQGETEKVWYKDCNNGKFILGNIFETMARISEKIYKSPSIAELLEELKDEIYIISYIKSVNEWQVLTYFNESFNNPELADALAELYIKLKGVKQ